MVREHLLRIGATIDMEPGRLEELITAVSEAFANAVEHAQTTVAVEIVVKYDRKHRLTVTVRDYGCGIEEAAIRQPLPPVGAERGRGIPLIRRCTSWMRISVPRGGGTLVTMSWERSVATGTHLDQIASTQRGQ